MWLCHQIECQGYNFIGQTWKYQRNFIFMVALGTDPIPQKEVYFSYLFLGIFLSLFLLIKY